MRGRRHPIGRAASVVQYLLLGQRAISAKAAHVLRAASLCVLCGLKHQIGGPGTGSLVWVRDESGAVGPNGHAHVVPHLPYRIPHATCEMCHATMQTVAQACGYVFPHKIYRSVRGISERVRARRISNPGGGTWVWVPRSPCHSVAVSSRAAGAAETVVQACGYACPHKIHEPSWAAWVRVHNAGGAIHAIGRAASVVRYLLLGR